MKIIFAIMIGSLGGYLVSNQRLINKSKLKKYVSQGLDKEALKKAIKDAINENNKEITRR